MFITSILAMGQAPNQTQGAQPQGNFLTMFAPLILIFVIFYFLLIRPQQKQQKKLRQMITNIHKGDKIITRGGIHGRIAAIEDNTVTVEIADRVQIKLNRDAVIHVAPASE